MSTPLTSLEAPRRAGTPDGDASPPAPFPFSHQQTVSSLTQIGTNSPICVIGRALGPPAHMAPLAKVALILHEMIFHVFKSNSAGQSELAAFIVCQHALALGRSGCAETGSLI
jgi:hypothetical protein